MATVLEFSVVAEEFPLGRTFRRLPAATVELERIVPTGDTVFPYLWVRGATPSAVSRAVEAVPWAGGITLVDDLRARGGLYRAIWDEGADGLVAALVEAPVTLLSARGHGERWRFRLRADDHEDATTFSRICADHGVSISLSRLRSLDATQTDADANLTGPQFEALALAYERGYFDEPRRATLSDLATDLGITRQSLAGRLRRGHRNLLAGLLESGDGE